MNNFDYLESQGQTNIFDYLEITPTSKRNKMFVEGDIVKLRLYEDEVEYIFKTNPHLMNDAYIVEVFDGYYSVKFDHEIIKVDGEKLLLI